MAEKLKNVRQRNYLARDFDGFRAQLIEYARIFYPDKIQDFSEASLGGLLVDMAAMVGDTMSFYLDHQFNELNYTRAVELSNIETHLNNAGVKIRGKAPASTYVKLSFIVGSKSVAGQVIPDTNQLPKVIMGTTLRATNGTTFTTIEDVDYAATDFLGELIAEVEIATTDTLGAATTFKVSRSLQAVGGKLVAQTFSIPDVHVSFRTITLSSADVSSVLSVVDLNKNTYYEVDDLSQDNVFKAVSTESAADQSEATSNLEIIPAPYRFTKSTSLTTRLTTLRFGSGNAKSVQDNVISDPSTLALPLVGTTTFSRFSIDPNSLLNSNSLGISPRGTSLTINYLAGGGLNTNVGSGTINQVTALNILFPSAATSPQIQTIKASVAVTNPNPAAGGDDVLSVAALKAKISSANNSQNRIVTREDLLARIYTLPAQFGRVYRAGVTPSTDNNLSSDLYIVSRDSSGKLATASDTLKLNLRNYLNEFRLISESIHIKDAKIINFGVEFTIRVTPNANKITTLQGVLNNLKILLDVSKFQVGEPIIESDLIFSILNSSGVQALPSIRFLNFFGTQNEQSYSSELFDLNASLMNGLITPPAGAIFELKYSDSDIIGNVL